MSHHTESPKEPVGFPLSFRADSVIDINWQMLCEEVGQPPTVLFDYDQAVAFATNPVLPEVRTSICEARDIGHIAGFGMASDNPFVGALSGIRSHADHIFGPFLAGKRVVTKATPAFYERIINELNADPTSVVMIGHDARRDIANAQAVGIHTIEVPTLGTLMQGLRLHRGRRLVESAVRFLPTRSDLDAAA
jgi:FMN phosphatase YigB (HAD superfamily)